MNDESGNRSDKSAAPATTARNGASLALRVASWSVVAVLAAGFIGSGAASSQAMTDPMRPPEAYLTHEDGAISGGPVLQSVMISPTRRTAIISGDRVRLGEKYGDAVLIEVAEGEVVLQRADTTQVLKMYPGVVKRGVPSARGGTGRNGKAGGADAGTTGPRSDSR
ncbi:MAG: hypothetical protein OEP48_08370 [Betaproteobacteria bacterium]|nr:hypothetical protein [Betaproteobacteria bacterium]